MSDLLKPTVDILSLATSLMEHLRRAVPEGPVTLVWFQKVGDGWERVAISVTGPASTEPLVFGDSVRNPTLETGTPATPYEPESSR